MRALEIFQSKWLWLALVTLASGFIYPQFSLTHDASWYLVSTRMYLDGADLYSGVVEINPPLAFYVTAPPVILSGESGVSPTLAFFYYLIALGALSSAWVLGLLKASDLEPGAQVLLFGASIFANFVLPLAEFGQREHLLLIFSLPYLYYLLMQERLTSLPLWEKVALGGLAFFGLALKPYFLLIPTGIALFRVVRTRGTIELFNPANIALGVALVIYLLHIIIAHPLYLTEIVPIATEVYASYRFPADVVLVRREFLSVPLIAFLYLYEGRISDGFIIDLFGASVGAIISYLVQFKGWNYQLLPAAFFLALSAVWISYLKRDSLRKHVVLGLALLVCFLVTIGSQVARGPYKSRTTQSFGTYIDRPHERILVLSSEVSVSFPFVNEVSGIWTSRFPAQWYIPGAIVGRSKLECENALRFCNRYDVILDTARQAIVEDFTQNRPDIVFVDEKPAKRYFGGEYFEYLPFLLADPLFRREFEQFHVIGRTGGYSVWRRVDPSDEVAGAR